MAHNASHEYGFKQAQQAAEFVFSQMTLRPKIAVVLGSGLGQFANELSKPLRIAYRTIPHFPVSSVVGHAGDLIVGTLGAVPLAVMSGRVHLYEGYSSKQAAFPARVLGRLGVKAFVLTNAAGGINRAFQQGGLVLIKDHINLQGQNPLTGANDDRFGLRFPDMTEAYSKRFRALALDASERMGLKLEEGVYAALAGPSYETPAEIRYLRAIGADMVGMSTVPEVIAARHMGIEVLAISCVTNMAAGILDKPIVHDEVLQVGQRVQSDLLSLLRTILPQIAKILD